MMHAYKNSNYNIAVDCSLFCSYNYKSNQKCNFVLYRWKYYSDIVIATYSACLDKYTHKVDDYRIMHFIASMLFSMAIILVYN